MNYVKLIHIAKSKAHLDDDTYRALLWGASGVYSSKEVRIPRQYNDIRKAFKVLGVDMPYDSGRERKANSPMERKAYALWCDLHEAGLVADKGWAAMVSFRRRQFPGQDILTLAQQSHFIEILKQWLERGDC